MQFIERVFHVSPDGGSGVFEALIVAVVLACAAAGMLLVRARGRARRRAGRP